MLRSRGQSLRLNKVILKLQEGQVRNGASYSRILSNIPVLNNMNTGLEDCKDAKTIEELGPGVDCVVNCFSYLSILHPPQF